MLSVSLHTETFDYVFLLKQCFVFNMEFLAFGSSYSHEVSMGDDFWRKRVARPDAKTFVAIDNKEFNIVSSLTLVRGGQVSPLLAMQIGLLAEERDVDSATLLHWAVNGVYTIPCARRQGISKSVFKAAVEFAYAAAEAEEKSCLVTIVARSQNEVAVAMYQRLGFTALSYVNDSGNVTLYMLRKGPKLSDIQLL